MGVLKNITDEYFGDSMRSEDYVEFNTDKMIPLDMGGSVLWADRELEIVDGGLWYVSKTCFTCRDGEELEKRLKGGWRIPTVDEYFELYEPETGTVMELVLSSYEYKSIFRNEGNGTVLEFDKDGKKLGKKFGKVEEAGRFLYFCRLVYDKEIEQFGIFNCNADGDYIEMLKNDKSNIHTVYKKKETYTPVRLVKDKK